MAKDFSDILNARYSRRNLLRAGAVGAALVTTPAFARMRAKPAQEMLNGTSSLTFAEVKAGLDTKHHLTDGYKAQILMRWGDKVLPDAQKFTPKDTKPEIQAQQFGFNNDFIAYFPLDNAPVCGHGLLCVNHEYTDPACMFSGYANRKTAADEITDEEHAIEMEAHGVSVVEIKRDGRDWNPVLGKYNRRITATTPMKISGPAAGHKRMQTSADPKGERVLGTFGNCAGGITPWGTYLTCEENVDVYFLLHDYKGKELENHQNMTIGTRYYHRWDKIDDRFNVEKEPNEPNRFGWVVEIDPNDPNATPIKRTALGRFKHEGASSVVNKDGRVVVYMGDDQAFQHIYKFVSNGHYNPSAINPNLLDDGVLYVAKFEESGALNWLPLIYGEGPLTKKNGFHSQADVMIETRKAAALLGATPMDRPEDIEVNPKTQNIYASMTKNPLRTKADAVNRRAHNPMGYILEMIPPEDDHTSDQFAWEIFLEGGDPDASGNKQGFYHTEPTKDGQLACPDNLAFDIKGRIWITTDGQPKALGKADALYAADTQGKGRGQTRCFFRGPIGCEVTGPQFTRDGRTLFLSIQHPAEGSSFDEPTTRWPDFKSDMPPRPAIIAITKDDGDIIG
ncbi:MAG: PhoX family phosphatase [Rickettsiales bacterium]|nr:PhoX family phosphatase [Rickettsiales bacterium]